MVVELKVPAVGESITEAFVNRWYKAEGEFVNKDDSMVRTLLRNRIDQYADYTEEGFEQELAKRFEIVRRERLGSGTRTLYYARNRAR